MDPPRPTDFANRLAAVRPNGLEVQASERSTSLNMARRIMLDVVAVLAVVKKQTPRGYIRLVRGEA